MNLFRGDALHEMYRKFRSLLQRPVWLTAGSARPTDEPSEIVEDHEEEPVVRESPDVSHVNHPEPTHTPHDEAVELVSRRLEVLASRADRVERTLESMSPVRVSEMPSRAEFQAVEERAEATRKRCDELSRQLADIIEAHSTAMHALEDDRATLAAMKKISTRIEDRFRDLAEEISDLRQTNAGFSALFEGLRNEVDNRDAMQVSLATRRLAGVYTLAIVALFAALLTLVLVIAK